MPSAFMPAVQIIRPLDRNQVAVEPRTLKPQRLHHVPPGISLKPLQGPMDDGVRKEKAQWTKNDQPFLHHLHSR